MFYTQQVFISCILEKFFLYSPSRRFYIGHDHIDPPFLFLLQKYFYFAQEHIVAFCLFLFQKDFSTFHGLLFEAFLCFFIIVICHFLYIEKKLSSSEFSLPESEEISMLSIIYIEILFSLTTSLDSPKNT